MQPDLTPKQQTSEAVRQAETILIVTGQNPTIDQATAVLALSAILRKFGKKVSAIMSDPLPPQLSFLDTTSLTQSLSGLRDFIIHLDLGRTEVDKLRYEVTDGKLNVFITPFQGGFSPTDVSFDYGDYHFDLAIVLGVASKNRIDKIMASNPTLFESLPVLNLDFHRSNESYGAVNLIEPTASSLCEILVALSESLQSGLIDADIATTMLTGLMSSTDRFTAGHTTSKSMTVAAQLMAAGARQPQIVRALYQSARNNDERPRRDAERTPRPDRVERTPREDRSNSANNDRIGGGRRDDRLRRDDRDGRAPQPDTRLQSRSDQPQQQSASREAEPAPAYQSRQVADLPAPSSAAVAPIISDPHADVAGVPVPVYEPIIEPGHVEMMQRDEAPVSDQLAMDVPAMADFSAAAQVFETEQPQAQSLNSDDVNQSSSATSDTQAAQE